MCDALGELMERPEVCNCEQALALQKEVRELQVRLDLAQNWIPEAEYDEYDQADREVLAAGTAPA